MVCVVGPGKKGAQRSGFQEKKNTKSRRLTGIATFNYHEVREDLQSRDWARRRKKSWERPNTPKRTLITQTAACRIGGIDGANRVNSSRATYDQGGEKKKNAFCGGSDTQKFLMMSLRNIEKTKSAFDEDESEQSGRGVWNRRKKSGTAS